MTASKASGVERNASAVKHTHGRGRRMYSGKGEY